MEGQETLKSVRIVYGTETGTAQDLAKEFMLVKNKQLRIDSFQDIASISQFNPESFPSTLWIFFISTTGQGDFPYSMRPIWKKLLIKAHPLLTSMKFTIFSLGDRSYGDNFCMAARKFRQRLISLQAQQVVDIGLGDEQQPNGYFYQYKNNWYPNLFNYFKQNNMLIQQNQTSKQQQNQTLKKQSQEGKQQKQLNVTGDQIQFGKGMGNGLRRFGMKENQFQLRIKNRQQICSNLDRKVFTLDTQILNFGNKVELGDILSIYPANNPDHVNFLIQYFKISQTDYLKQAKTHVQSITYKQILTSFINVSSTLNHSFFISRSDIPDLSNYTQNQLFKDKLHQLAESYDQYHNYIRKYKRNVIQLIQDFQITNLPINQFIQRSTQIVPRKYSIAQVLYNQQGNTELRILFKIAKKNINENRIHRGICTHDLALWSELQHSKRCSILKGQFQYKEKIVNNLIFITLGTGIAPFMHFLDQAKHSKNQWNIILFYTNRYQNEVYFQSLLQELTALDKLNPFLSFTGEGGKRITRFVEDNSKVIQDMIDKVGLQQMKIMVCGPKQVCEGMENILGRELSVDMKQLKKKKIFLYQNW